MSILSEKVKTLVLETEEREAQILEVCNLLNTPLPIAPRTITKYKLRPLLIPHLVTEGIISPEKLKAISVDVICADLLRRLIEEHYSGAIALSPVIEQLLAAGQTFGILNEQDVQAVRDRLDIGKVVELDKDKSLEQRRYEEWTEEVQVEPISWAQANLGRVIEGYEIAHVLGE